MTVWKLFQLKQNQNRIAFLFINKHFLKLNASYLLIINLRISPRFDLEAYFFDLINNNNNLNYSIYFNLIVSNRNTLNINLGFLLLENKIISFPKKLT